MIKKLLILEDDEILSKAYIQKFFEDYELKMAESADAGLNIINGWVPDVILLDLYMPGKYNGIDFLKMIKEDQKYKNIPVIVITNLPDSINMVLDMGAVSCFMKTDMSMEKIAEEVKKVSL